MDHSSQPQKGPQQSTVRNSSKFKVVDRAELERRRKESDRQRQERLLHSEDVRELMLETKRHNFPKVTNGVDRTFTALNRPEIPPRNRFDVPPPKPKVIFQDEQPWILTYLPWFAYRWRDNLAESWRETKFMYRERYLLIKEALGRLRKSFSEENRHY